MSTKKEYTVSEPYELTATPISWLEEITSEDLVSQQDDILLVVSQPNLQVQDTGYMSKKVSLGTLKEAFGDILQVDEIQAQIDALDERVEQLTDLKEDLTALVSDTAYVCNEEEMPIDDPCILSSITYDRGNITDLGGYKLKDALSAVLSSEVYPKLKAEQISCTTLKVGDNSLEPVLPATANSYGTVKVADEDTPSDTDTVVYIRQNNGPLYISKQYLENMMNNTMAQLSARIKDEVLREISNSYFRTKIVASLPQTLQSDTIYYVSPGYSQPAQQSS